MNGRQRARWAADIVTELQKLQKRSQGRPEAAGLARALAELAAARSQMLAEARGAEAQGAEEVDREGDAA